MTARQVRAVRGVAASSATTVVAAAAHTIGGGGAPAPLLIALSAILAAPIATALVGARLSAARTAVAVLAAQIVFHAVFALFGTDSGIVYTAADPSAHHSMIAMATGTATAGHSMLVDPAMLLAHLVAAAATVLLLHRGESLLRALGRGVRRLLPSIATPAPLPAHPAAIVAPAARVAPSLLFASDRTRRGPPLLLG
jgi:glucan phosphoethanolaminetransferase (alkaline phosphatase superfamily)